MPALCLCVALALVAAPATQPATAQTTRPQPRFSASERAASARITPAAISGPIRFLSDDLLEGRKPGSVGADLAARVAARLGRAYAADVTAVAVGSGALELDRPMYAGKVRARLRVPLPAVVSVRPGAHRHR